MKNNIQALLDRIGDENKLGDVMHLMEDTEHVFGTKDIAKFLILWRNCGLRRSLTEIFDCEWAWGHLCQCGKYLPGDVPIKGACSMHAVYDKKVPKDPAVKALGEFLLSLNLCT